MRRRAFLALPLALGLGCKKELRCQRCGMKIDPLSPWKTELVTEAGAVVTFDTPTCAFTAWRSGKTAAKTLRVQDYYEHRWHEADELRFVIGGDVLGPMGPDLVPVLPPLVAKFLQDHGAERALTAAEVSSNFLENRK